MVVFIFKLRQKIDAGEVTEKLIAEGVLPKCREIDELAYPSWRETSEGVFKPVKGSWKERDAALLTGNVFYVEGYDEEGRVCRHYDSDGNILLEERIVEEAEIINLTEIEVKGSFGNGVTVMPIAEEAEELLCCVVVDRGRKADMERLIQKWKAEGLID